MHDEIILQFLQGRGPDHKGRYHRDILNFSNEELENSHDYIQWLFPLTEKSLGMPRSPILEDAEVIERLKVDETVLKNVRAALECMQSFYTETEHWLRRNNHNHRRITRIIKSVVLLGLTEEAEDFYTFVLRRVEMAQPVTEESLGFWRDSIKGIKS